MGLGLLIGSGIGLASAATVGTVSGATLGMTLGAMALAGTAYGALGYGIDQWSGSDNDALGLFGGEDASLGSTATGSSSGSVEGVNEFGEDTTVDTGSSGVEEKGNVGGLGGAEAAGASANAANSARLGSYAGSGLNTFGFTDDAGTKQNTVSKLGA